MHKDNNPKPQVVSRDKLLKQKAELERYMHAPSFKDLTPTQKNNTLQKLEEIKVALQEGEIDPAFRQNKNYREGGQGKNN